MRIIFVTNLELWSMGMGKGGEAFTQTIKKYKNDNNLVYLVSDIAKNQKTNIINPKYNILVKPSFAKKFIHIRKIGLLFRYIDHFITTYRFEKAIIRIINQKKDVQTVLYAYEVNGVKACKNVSMRFKLPLVTRFQGTKMVSYQYTWRNRILRYPHYQALGTAADLVIMTDDGTKGAEILDNIGNQSPRLFLKNGLDLMKNDAAIDASELRSRYVKNAGDTIFLTVSRLTGWKRVDRVIHGFADYLRQGGKGKLIIVGDGDCRTFLEELACDLKISENIYFTGAVKHEDVYKFMACADVFLSFFDMSNVGNPLLEAMTIGKCIVTYDVGDTKKLINGSNGVLLTAQTLHRLGDVMLELSQNPQKRESLGKKAKEYAMANFMTWEKRMDIEYEAVLSLGH